MSKVEAVSRERAIQTLALGLPAWPQVYHRPMKQPLPASLAGWSWMYCANPDHDCYVIQLDGLPSSSGAITEGDYDQARKDAGLDDPIVTGGTAHPERRGLGINEALEVIGKEWSEWPDATALQGIESATLPGWFWHDSQRTGMHLKRPGQALIITRRHWKDARDKYIAKLGAHAALVDNPPRPLIDVLVEMLTEWPAAGSTVTPPLPEGVFWCHLSNDHAWYAYRQHGGDQCHWPEWYSAARAKGLDVKAPASEIERLACEPLTESPSPSPLARLIEAASDPAHDYHTLASVLVRAFDQASAGKGKERHAKDLPFDFQPMMNLISLYGVGFALGQTGKKNEESMRLDHGRATRERLGAIVYTAGAIVHSEANNNG